MKKQKRNFWKKLKKPFFCLAPMDGVTDVVFRKIVGKTARPDVYFTEFISCDGLFSPGKEVLMQALQINKNEHPIVAQIWGNNPETYYKAAALIGKLGFDGVDINMGCPDRNVVKTGSCSALIENASLAKEIVLATIEGAKSLPVSVKTRIGFKKVQTENWAETLLSLPINVLTIHGRTAKQESNVPADWIEISKVVRLRNDMDKDTLIIGNGDVVDREDGEKKAVDFGVDGLMIGRGIFKDLWAFESAEKKPKADHNRMLKIMLEHINLFEKVWGENKNYHILKKYYKIYVGNFRGANQLRIDLMGTKNYKDAKSIINKFLKK